MRQYELAIRIAQVHHLVDERKYKKALAVMQTLDMRQVRALSDLRVFAEVYTKTEQYDAAKATYLRIYRRSHTKRVLYRLIYLSIRTNALNDAEAYYQEFVRMNPNVRDALILRYRIDKASGAPMDQLIEILQELKQEEYIEEWAYELAKLYHRAGRREECKAECQDIILWFGTGEIVERAKILIDHLEERDAVPYYDDRDFTMPKNEESNPEDTGSLPDLKDYIRERKSHKREEHRELLNSGEREEDNEQEGESVHVRSSDAGKKGKDRHEKSRKDSADSEDEFIDDYEDDDFGDEISQKAMHKLSGLLKLGKKEESSGTSREREEKARKAAVSHEREEKVQNNAESSHDREEKANKTAVAVREREENVRKVSAPERQTAGEQEKIGFLPHSQSGMGITQDLAKEIAAIYEMEQREQLREKAVTVIRDNADDAVNVVERMTNAVQKNSREKSYIPLDIEEIQPIVRDIPQQTEEEGSDPLVREFENVVSEKRVLPERQETVIQKDQERAAIQEEFRELYGEQLPDEEQLPAPGAELLRVDQEQLYENDLPEGDGSVDRTEISVEEQQEFREELSELMADDDGAADDTFADRQPGPDEEQMRERALTEMLEQEVAEIQRNINLENEQETVETGRQDAETLRNLLEEEVAETPQAESELFDTQPVPEIKSAEPGTYSAEGKQKDLAQDFSGEQFDDSVQMQQEASVSEQQTAAFTENRQTVQALPESASEHTSVLEGYQAPEIPVVETSYMEMPEIAYEELPTTRALQQSFQNVLKLIAGELDPSHFVLMGDGTDRIVGVSKQIVKVMKETGYLSQGRIAKIHARQLNKMDLISFRSQLKGNCLLVEGASDLLFPTITRLFSIMEEYFGDFVVILVDEGTTLDQLFRFVPALAKKFKYIIDISKYMPEDYQ